MSYLKYKGYLEQLSLILKQVSYLETCFFILVILLMKRETLKALEAFQESVDGYLESLLN
jgi:hypothetical protein